MDSNLPAILTPKPLQTVGNYLDLIRPYWKARSLIERVERILPVDPGSACQRLLNATIHDLREKVVIAGLDIAEQAAKLYRLPPVTKQEDVENYSTDRLLDLSYRMGVLTRPEWRRLKRCYDIRRDLEHEDDEYEAGLEDCVYIFKTCVEVVLTRDPVHLLKVTDIKEVVEQPQPQFPEQQFLDDYRNAPDSRQRDILFFLVSTMLDTQKPEVVRTNALEMVKHLSAATNTPVKLELATWLQQRIGRSRISAELMGLAHAAEVAPYLNQNTRQDYFAHLHRRLQTIGHSWRQHKEHGAILAELEDAGGLRHCPDAEARRILLWLVLCYVGAPGGMTRYGHRREVFWSDAAAPIVERMVRQFSGRELAFLKSLREDRGVETAVASKKAIAQRYEELLDLAGDK